MVFSERIPSQSAEIFDLHSGEIVHETKEESFQIFHGGAKINFRIARPIDALASDTINPIIIDPGFLATRGAYERFAHELASRGAPVAYYAVPRRMDLAHSLSRQHLLDPIAMHSSVTYGVSKEMRRQFPDNPETFDYVSHSLGTLGLARFIQKKPDYVNTATILAGAGLGHQSIVSMMSRTPVIARYEIASFVKSMSIHDKREHGVQTLLHIGLNPLRTIQEGYYAATEDASLALTSAKNAGIPIGALWYDNDSYFPSRKVTEKVKSMFDAVAFLEGDHLGPQKSPRLAALEILKIIKALNTTK